MVTKRSVSLDDEVASSVEEAARQDGVSFSAWLSSAAEKQLRVRQGRIGFVDPADWEIVVQNPSLPRPTAYLNHGGQLSSNGNTVEVATAKILELAVPFGRLGLKAGEPIRFYVELLGGDASLDRAPREGIFELAVPTPDFERIMWQV
jgi:hypothetical protein